MALRDKFKEFPSHYTRSRSEILGAGVTGTLLRAKNLHDVYINLDTIKIAVRHLHPPINPSTILMPVGNNKMASILFTIGGAVMNALAFSGTKILLSKLMDHGEKERKRHDLAP